MKRHHQNSFLRTLSKKNNLMSTKVSIAAFSSFFVEPMLLISTDTKIEKMFYFLIWFEKGRQKQKSDKKSRKKGSRFS